MSFSYCLLDEIIDVINVFTCQSMLAVRTVVYIIPRIATISTSEITLFSYTYNKHIYFRHRIELMKGIKTAKHNHFHPRFLLLIHLFYANKNRYFLYWSEYAYRFILTPVSTFVCRTMSTS